MQQVSVDRSGGDVCGSSELLLRFVNTGPHGSGQVELLDSGAALRQWLLSVGLLAEDDGVTQADAAAARELREALSTVFRAHSNCADGAMLLPEAEIHLQRTAERHPLTPRLTAEGCVFVPSQTGVFGAFGALFAAASDLASRGAWSRLKMCKNLSCHSGFFDKTRNSSGLYCSATCTSQVSQRAYRTRLKTA